MNDSVLLRHSLKSNADAPARRRLSAVMRAVMCTVAVAGLLPLSAFASDASATKASPSHPMVQEPGNAKKEVKQTWNLQNADIRAVINTVAKITGKSFIIDPKVQGKMTIVSTKPMSSDEFYNAFLSMLQVLNYTVVPTEGNIYKVVPSLRAKEMGAPLVTEENKSEVGGNRVIVRMVPVVHTSAKQLVSVIRPFMQASSSITAYAPSNSLILSGASANVAKIVTMIQQLDQKHSSRINFVPLKHADAAKIVAILQSYRPMIAVKVKYLTYLMPLMPVVIVF